MITLIFTLFFSLMVPPAIARDGNEKDEFKQIDSSRLSPTVATASSPISTDMPKEDAKKGEDRIVGACLVDNCSEVLAFCKYVNSFSDVIDFFECFAVQKEGTVANSNPSLPFKRNYGMEIAKTIFGAGPLEYQSPRYQNIQGMNIYTYHGWAYNRIKEFCNKNSEIIDNNWELEDFIRFHAWRHNKIRRFLKENPHISKLKILGLGNVDNLFDALDKCPNTFTDLDIAGYKYGETHEPTPFDAARFFERHNRLEKLCLSEGQWKKLKGPLLTVLSAPDNKDLGKLKVTIKRYPRENDLVADILGLNTVKYKDKTLHFKTKSYFHNLFNSQRTICFPQPRMVMQSKLKQQFIAGANWLSRHIGRR